MIYAVGVRTERRYRLPAPLVLVAPVVELLPDGTPIVAVGDGVAALGAHPWELVDDLDEVRPAAVDLLADNVCQRLTDAIRRGDIVHTGDAWLPQTLAGEDVVGQTERDATHVLTNGADLLLDADAAAVFRLACIEPELWLWRVSPTAWDRRAG